MAKRPTLLQHFRSFAQQNHIEDIEVVLQYFAVFGGTGWKQESDDIILLDGLHDGDLLVYKNRKY